MIGIENHESMTAVDDALTALRMRPRQPSAKIAHDPHQMGPSQTALPTALAARGVGRT
jgi:hypothetical protein